ncbi:MAG TPA: hypothetical protein GX509_03200 [Firmicutes bacterium]|nr:hypothetical protein [Bacillota bacterium]HHY97728.1 hypothetical protein [Bacillota bacterium]
MIPIGTTKRAVALAHHEDMVGTIDEPVEGPLSKDRVGKQGIPILWSKELRRLPVKDAVSPLACDMTEGLRYVRL